MIPAPYRLYAALGTGLVLLALVAAVVLHLRADQRLREAHETLRSQAGTVVVALREASDNPELEWEQAPGQIVALGESNRRLRVSISEQNDTIAEMAREAVRLRAHADELRRIAERAEAQRRSALDRLSDLAATPGTREDCMTLLREAEEALDLVREAGL